ncbi:MAG: hypothetical protein NZ742_12470, partial [Acidobacteria bacterium]|nr:hypothetical protein [Acidobacteriota bacterium]
VAFYFCLATTPGIEFGRFRLPAVPALLLISAGPAVGRNRHETQVDIARYQDVTDYGRHDAVRPDAVRPKVSVLSQGAGHALGSGPFGQGPSPASAQAGACALAGMDGRSAHAQALV